jgi:hypothetical protein
MAKPRTPESIGLDKPAPIRKNSKHLHTCMTIEKIRPDNSWNPSPCADSPLFSVVVSTIQGVTDVTDPFFVDGT